MKINVIMGLGVLICVSSCKTNSGNQLSFHDDIKTVREKLIETALIYQKIQPNADATMQFGGDSVYITGRSININNGAQEFPFTALSAQEYRVLTDNFRFLAKNNITTVLGPERYGFAMFRYMPEDDDEWTDRRYLTVSKDDSTLNKFGFRVLDRQASIVLFVNK